MSSLLKVEWTIRSCGPMGIMRHCPRCSQVRTYQPTGKFRLNANGSRLDAWLIYRCSNCSRRWNRAVFQRVNIAELPKDVLEQLQNNDQDLADFFCRSRALATGPISDTSTERYTVDVKMNGQRRHIGEHAILLIHNPTRCEVRLDRLLANGLKLSRREILDLFECGAMNMIGTGRKQLRRAPPDSVTINVSEPDVPNGPVLIDRVLGSWKQYKRS